MKLRTNPHTPPSNDWGLFIARFFTGFLMLYLHGWGKLIGGPDRWKRLGTALSDVIGVDMLALPFGFMASAAESIGALCLILGLATRPAAFLLAFTMLVATTKHFPDGLKGMEKPMLFLCLSLVILLLGAGRYSLDAWRSKRK